MGQLKIGPKSLLPPTAPHSGQQQLFDLRQQIHSMEQVHAKQLQDKDYRILRLLNTPKEVKEVEKTVEVEKIVYKTIEIPKEVKVIEERIVERTIEVPIEVRVIEEKIVEKLVEVPKEVKVFETKFIEKQVMVKYIPNWMFLTVGIETLMLSYLIYLKF